LNETLFAMVWKRLVGVVTGRRSWLLALAVAVAVGRSSR
jgi:hypothetical protein